MSRIDVIKPGALSLLQDRGRHGYQHLGVVVGGAMDEWSHRCANALLGNDEDEATLEITLMGPSLLFHEAQAIALCGANLSARIGEADLPMNRAVWVRAGARLDFGKRIEGMRSYLAVRGGFAVPSVMDSRSTYVRGAFGGLQGRALKKGDVLEVGGVPPLSAPSVAASLARLGDGDFIEIHEPEVHAPAIAPQTADAAPVRVIAGQQWALFTAQAQEAFMQAEFRVSPQSDRMGFRLEGPVLERRHAMEMISEGVAFGTVQVPPDGQPIVLMADRQTTGGYPKIACVASVDLPLVAQLAPQQALRFEPISLEAAQALYLGRERALARLRSLVRAAGEAP
ncbi:biotin-dependent carboxyltransferase family protein [Variovorax sp. IB41]|uniref:5-oxoprolinase subunit C family protein n=1 Tax=Variovorax sp. IB41 TaxID=2779370 RepID=UPI0018E90755|nr:biotin-dependent carboxyltransferase family protein [Variovorax sp. IB41]MBJ2155054.1 biotin-dependent carboxyltransferase [Variovorax sp. IB41]